ncbi:B3 domain-containing transcription factor ABI3 [Abeliophyllum distichum]|uniref:B3 domain-containing transcription factor ABI3 n=1 Tax=Abeliophyllum distichum TaxID=126358 RepID=A0ABD1Q6G2_9LAMI
MTFRRQKLQRHQSHDVFFLYLVKPEPTILPSTASIEIPPPPEDAIGNVDCMNVIENFGYMDLIDSNEIWDPSIVFQSEYPQEYLENQKEAAMAVLLPLERSQQVQKKQNQDEENDGFSFLQGNSELDMDWTWWKSIFFELKKMPFIEQDIVDNTLSLTATVNRIRR